MRKNFAEARQQFSGTHFPGVDDQKAPDFHAAIANYLHFEEIKSQKKLVFLIVAHLVHTLPFFLEALSQLGDIAAIIPKQSHCVPTVVSSIKTIYTTLLRSDIDKTILKTDHSTSEKFLQNLFAEWHEYQFIILDHGGYFSEQLPFLLTMQDRIAGIVEHTLNGEIKYQRVFSANTSAHACFPFFSIARSTLKAGEDRHVAQSIVRVLETKIYGGAGFNQDLNRLKKIAVIGYGHIGEKVAQHLRKIISNPYVAICIIDTNQIALKRAEADGFEISVEKEASLRDADLIITASSSSCLTASDLLQLQDSACIACVTSSDDQLSEDALKEYELISSCEAVSVYQHPETHKKIFLAAQGGSINFLMGSTPHPILHAVFAAVCVSAMRCATQDNSSHFSIQSISESDTDSIKLHYEKIFGARELSTAVFGIYYSSQLFFGRKKELQALRNALNKNTTGVISQSVAGCGGVGKTSLANAYIHQAIDKGWYDWIGYFNATTEENLYRDFLRLAKQLSIPLCDTDSPMIKIDAIYRLLQTRYSRILLVFDDASKKEVLEKAWIKRDRVNFLPPQKEMQLSHWVVTTQNKHFKTATVIALGMLDEADAIEMVQYYHPKISVDEAKLLVTTLHCFPLALRQALAYLQQHSNYSILNYVTAYQTTCEISRFFLDNDAPLDHEKSVYATVMMTVLALSIKNFKIVSLLNQLAYLSSEKVPLGFIQQIDNYDHSLLQELEKYSLIEFRKENQTHFFRMHHFVQMVIRLKQKETQSTEALAKILDVMYRVSLSSPDTSLFSHIFSVIDYHELHLPHQQPVEKIQLLSQLAFVLHFEFGCSKRSGMRYQIAKNIFMRENRDKMLPVEDYLAIQMGLAQTSGNPILYLELINESLDSGYLTAEGVLRFLKKQGILTGKVAENETMIQCVLGQLLHPSSNIDIKKNLPNFLFPLGLFDVSIVYLIYQGSICEAAMMAGNALQLYPENPQASFFYVETQLLKSGMPPVDAVPVLQSIIEKELQRDFFWNSQVRLMLSLVLACRHALVESTNVLFLALEKMKEKQNAIQAEQSIAERVLIAKGIIDFTKEKYFSENHAFSFSESYRILGRIFKTLSANESDPENKVTWVDVALSCYTASLQCYCSSILSKYEYACALSQSGKKEDAFSIFDSLFLELLASEKNIPYAYAMLELKTLPKFMRHILIDQCQRRLMSPEISLTFYAGFFSTHLLYKKNKLDEAHQKINELQTRTVAQNQLAGFFTTRLQEKIEVKKNNLVTCTI